MDITETRIILAQVGSPRENLIYNKKITSYFCHCLREEVYMKHFGPGDALVVFGTFQSNTFISRHG